MRKYDVTFYRAFSVPTYGTRMRGYTIPDMMFGDHKRVVIERDSLADLLDTIERAANALDYGVAVCVTMAKGERKPPGFDDATRYLAYNLVPEKETVPA